MSLSILNPFCMTAISIQIKFDRGCMVWKNLLFVVQYLYYHKQLRSMLIVSWIIAWRLTRAMER